MKGPTDVNRSLSIGIISVLAPVAPVGTDLQVCPAPSIRNALGRTEPGLPDGQVKLCPYEVSPGHAMWDACILGAVSSVGAVRGMSLP